MAEVVALRRRRGEVLENDILDAAWAELAAHGWAGLRMDRVAARAGTGKTSVYARWPSKGELVRAALARASAVSVVPSEEFTDLLGDLRTALDRLCVSLEGPVGEAVRGLVAEAKTLPRGPASHLDERIPIQVLADLVAHAQRQGELPQHDIPARRVNLGFTLVAHHYLINGRVPDAGDLDEILLLWVAALSQANPQE